MYYFDSYGDLLTGVQQIGTHYYYFDESGRMNYGTYHSGPYSGWRQYDTDKKRYFRLSENETCVIVGRCSDFVLLDRENSMHIYIYAPYQDRLKNSIEALKLSKDAAKKMIRDVDAARDNYQMHYAGYHPYDIRYKDILVNSSLYGVEGTADFLADAVKRRFGE